ncbi:MAG: c-type cytochrome [Nitrospirota bacterium]|nr:c-type cytochrome [Nitrospirota bacterium]
MSHSIRISLLVLATGWLWAGCSFLTGCNNSETMGGYQPAMGGNAVAGKALIQSYGCGSCHLIPGIRTAKGMVGPPLFFYSRRTIIAGELPNTPDNLIRWIENPPAIEPGTAMPDLGVSDSQARDMAAYLYTLR